MMKARCRRAQQTHISPFGTTDLCVGAARRGRPNSLGGNIFINLKSATLLKSQSVAAQTAKNAIFLVRTDFLPCVG